MRRFGAAFLDREGSHLTPVHRKVLAALAACRTPAMGWRLYHCDHCGHTMPVCNSCCDRHCPTCQAARRAAWLDARREELLPVEYFQVVFTVPEQLHGIAAAHPRLFYNLLFRAARETLLEVAASPEHLDAQIGGLMVLHTWGQTLQLHPHLHVIVPGGGLNMGTGSDPLDRCLSPCSEPARWIACRPGFFLPVEVLSKVFRGKLLAFLKHEYEAGRMPMTGGLSELSDPRQFNQWLSVLYAKDWCVFVEPPEDREPEQALKYLARYTYRVAISNSRLESIEGEGHAGTVTFRYKDYARDGVWDRMALPGVEFLRRFMQHVLPRGLMRIRSFGFLANRRRAEKLALFRRLLTRDERPSNPLPDTPPTTPEPTSAEPSEDRSPRCPHCGERALRLVGETARPTMASLVVSTYRRRAPDSS